MARIGQADIVFSSMKRRSASNPRQPLSGKAAVKTSRRGRPRTFEVNEALDAALGIFWRHGYEGASLDALTNAMGINRPSLYAAFGNKEALFRKAVDRYNERSNEWFGKAMSLPTAREVALAFLSQSLCDADPARPAGCLLVNAALSCSPESERVRRDLSSRRSANETSLRKRFEQSIRDGDLSRQIDAGTLARYVATVMNGLAVQATGGATPDQLRGVIDFAMQAFPKQLPKRR